MKQTRDAALVPPLHERRFQLAAAANGFLLALLAAGCAVAVCMVFGNGPLAGTQENRAKATGTYLPSNRVAISPRSLHEIMVHPDLIPTHHHPLLRQPAPDFELADTTGNAWNLKELLADCPLVLIFYYGYHCDHCVIQLFDVDRDLALFREVGARVVAISADPPELTRRRFKEYGPFSFPVLSDPGNKVAHAYQVFRGDYLRHGTFIIQRDSTVEWVNVGDAPFRRTAALLYQLAKMQGCLPGTRTYP